MASRKHHTLGVVRWAAMVLLLVIVGMALGMGARAFLLPLLPMKLRMLLDEHHAMQPSGGAPTGRDVAFWKSSMIPNFVSPKPGMDPMGMELIPVYRDELSKETNITLTSAVMQNVGVRTQRVVQAQAEQAVRTMGQVEYAEPLLGDVTLKVDGWVEELLVDFVGQRVERGQPLFRLYSPDLVSAQKEYLISRQKEAVPGERPEIIPRLNTVFSAHDKLRFWDVPESEIQDIQRTGKTKKAVTFESPFQGWVIEKHAYQGMYMMAGTVFYRIADLSTVWVYVYIYEYQLPHVRAGQPARLTLPFRPGEVFEGKVIYVYPDVDTKTRQIRVRLEFTNPDLRMKPGMYADVEILDVGSQPQLVVPLDAVIYTGQQKKADGLTWRVGFAYVQNEPGKFETREVTLGEDLQDGQVRVIDGLQENDMVVVSGQFLLDSERRVKEANLRMLTQTSSQSEPTHEHKHQ